MKNITFYHNACDATSQTYIDFDFALDMIKQGLAPGYDRTDYNLQTYTDYLRQLLKSNENQYKIEKRLLPMIAYGGMFSYRNKDTSNLIQYSNILILDFDFHNPTQEIIHELKSYLITYADKLHLYAVWQSPGHGVKAAMIHDNQDPSYHYELFCQIEVAYKQINIEVDSNCKDVTRTCYLNYDPDLWKNPRPVTPYHFVHNPAFHIPNQTRTAPTSTGVRGTFQHTPEELSMNNEFQKTYTDKTLMNRLHKQFDNQNPNYYKDGNRHREITRRATLFCNDGILFENALNSLKGKFGPKSRACMDEDKIERMVNSCYHLARADFGTQRAKYLSYRNSSNI
mgnify:CR=1 FL=1